MAERLGALSYIGIVKEAAVGTPLTPTDYIPLYDETFSTDINLQANTVAMGQRYKNYASFPGMRNHMGDFTVMAEPNTMARLVDATLTKTGTAGGGPYTHSFSLGISNSLTVDINAGNDIVFRYFGLMIEQMDPVYVGDEIQMKCKASALGSFSVRALSGTPTGTNPYTGTFDTTYDASPTTGLVVGDLIRVTKADGTTIDCTVATVPTGTTFTTTTDITGAASGDFVSLRPATPSYTNLQRFLWPNTQFCFGATASAALAATQTRVERSSTWSLVNSFESAKGADRSGAFDPAALPRTTGEITAKIKMFFDSPAQVSKFLSRTNQALVIRHFSSSGYELRVTIDQFNYKVGGKPKVKSSEILYHEFDLLPVYNTSNSEAFNIKVLNALATI